MSDLCIGHSAGIALALMSCFTAVASGAGVEFVPPILKIDIVINKIINAMNGISANSYKRGHHWYITTNTEIFAAVVPRPVPRKQTVHSMDH